MNFDNLRGLQLAADLLGLAHRHSVSAYLAVVSFQAFGEEHHRVAVRASRVQTGLAVGGLVQCRPVERAGEGRRGAECQQRHGLFGATRCAD